MPKFTDNKYLQSLLENLTVSHETETNYSPLEIELDPNQIDNSDLETLINFINQPRKRLFLFKIPGNEDSSYKLAFTARRSFLKQIAEAMLEKTSGEPKINPLKKDLQNPPLIIRAPIQIQKSFSLPKRSINSKKSKVDQSVQQAAEVEIKLVPAQIPELPVLEQQLQALGIQNIQDTALEKIRAHLDAFTDGIVPHNLPTGFDIDQEKKALCYTTNPKRLPSALAPSLGKRETFKLPTRVEQFKEFLPTVPETVIPLLNKENAKNALLVAWPAQAKEINHLLSMVKPSELEFIEPLLVKQFILGGEAHTNLLMQLLRTGINKKLNLEFLKDPVAQDALLSPKGLKNLQKLLQLPAEQREWWNTLASAHLQNEQHSFDFNVFFEAYTQIFLPRITEKNLTLPQPCPIQHKGHFLITLNRVIDVLEHAKNPQEQCLNLQRLNWGPLGVHYAMTQAPEQSRFKQVAACMELGSPQDVVIDQNLIYQNLANADFPLIPNLYRYMGQHWKAEIRLTDIQAQFEEIQNVANLEVVQKNQLSFIVASSFAEETPFTAEQWKKTLRECISLLQPLETADRNELIQMLSASFQFKPNPSLTQIQQILELSIELKRNIDLVDFRSALLEPLAGLLRNEGFETLNMLQARMQKLEQPAAARHTTLVSFIQLVHSNRDKLQSNTIKLLAALNEPNLNQDGINRLHAAIEQFKIQKPGYADLLLSLLAQINLSKSQNLPQIQDIEAFLNSPDLPQILPAECKTVEQQEQWLKDQIIEKNMLPGCVLGSGTISKLDDLIVEALVDATKKRQGILKAKALQEKLRVHLKNPFVPESLRTQLEAELMPLFDALQDLTDLLLSQNPQFHEILQKFAYFEERKKILLNANYRLFGSDTKGEFILSFLLEGKKKETDNLTGAFFGKALEKVHGLISGEIHDFFKDEKNRNTVKDVDPATILKWLAGINQTHSIIFLFKEELVLKKVLPALRKTLLQLDTQDPAFENSILDAAATIAEDQPSNEALDAYKTKIEAIAGYLNLLIDIKDQFQEKFTPIYKQLNTGVLSRLNFSHKKTLAATLLKARPEALEIYLKLAGSILEEAFEADEAAITRAINGLKEVFALSDLEPETQNMFFKMSMAHNLRNPSPFPLKVLNELKRSQLEEPVKSLLIKQIIQILSHAKDSVSPELINKLIQNTQLFIFENPQHAALCVALLKRADLHETNLGKELEAYPKIFDALSALEGENRAHLVTVLSGFTENKKDDSVDLRTLKDIAEGLGRRSAPVIKTVAQLFATPPYPIAQKLNTLLFPHGSEKLLAYCDTFDSNPFAAKEGQTRALEQQFATDRVAEALINLKDLMQGVNFPTALQMQLAQQLTFIETLGYTDPLNPNDYSALKKLTAVSREELKTRASTLLKQMRDGKVPKEDLETTKMELLAYLREIYFRSTGLFPNTTQMLVLLLSLHSLDTNNTELSNLLMRIKTGEGKSLITPMFAVLQWAQGGTVDVCTANRTLLTRDYENSCEPFFKFLGIKSTLIQADSKPEDYMLDGINCSTLEDMSLFRLATKEAKQEVYVQNSQPIHLILDECDDALLDQTTLYKLVAEHSQSDEEKDNPAQWIYPLAYQFINLPQYRNIDPENGKVWDEEEDLEQFRLFINKQINEEFKGEAAKQNFIMATSNTQLKQWLQASCKAATLVENKHFIVRPIKETDELGNEIIKNFVCVPLVKSTPKTGCIFTDGVQQALQARLIAERKDQAHYFVIDVDPPVLSSLSARGLIQFYQDTKGRIVGISGTPGDSVELQYLATLLGTQAIGVAPHAGDKRHKHPPVFTFSDKDTITAIHRAIDNIKLPITKKFVEIPDQLKTYAEQEAFILKAKEETEEWNKTQTQPVLIVTEDFEEAKNIGASLSAYEAQGFKIQVVTGKESPEELDQIIKEAGKANVITVGTAMLARGIDINPGNHPQGLFVIQAYPDSKRITTQIAGRAARNGKPGQWLPIYQIEPPKHWLEKILYFIFPWYRQRKCQEKIKELQNEIKAQANVDRLYNQAIDEAQQTLMQQVSAWEQLLLELYPEDSQVRQELYQWRETLLNELAQAQDSNVTQETLQANIVQFQKSICKLWETAREEKWAAKAQEALPRATSEQNLRINYLKQLDLSQELKIQRALARKAPPLKPATQGLMQQNLDAIILDKAGAVLEFTDPSPEERKELEFAQTKQLLPYLIGELFNFYPQAVEELSSDEPPKTAPFVLELFKSLFDKIIEQKNRAFLGAPTAQQLTQSIVQTYQDELKDANKEQIQDLLGKMKNLILAHNASMSLVEKFKMQGLILNFNKLYQQSGLIPDEALVTLATSYGDDVMKTLAQYLQTEFAWVKKSPRPLHAVLEREAGIQAANAIYDLAEQVQLDPHNKDKIQALYYGLQEHKNRLQTKHLFSIKHTNPFYVIHTALNAIDSLNMAPHCAQEFQEQCQNKAQASYHLDKFAEHLRKISASFKKDPVWNHLQMNLLIILNNKQLHTLTELHEAVARYSQYAAYHPYKKELRALKTHLEQAITLIKHPAKIDHELLLTEKAAHFADLFGVDKGQVRIQSGSDSINDYIEIQVENSRTIPGFTGYDSSYLANIHNERSRLTQQREAFAAIRDDLLHLTNPDVVNHIFAKKDEFTKLYTLKSSLAEDWKQGLDADVVDSLPKVIRQHYQHMQQLANWHWETEAPAPSQLEAIFGDDYNGLPSDKMIQHSKLSQALQEILEKKSHADEELTTKNEEIQAKKREISSLKEKSKTANGVDFLGLQAKAFAAAISLESLQSDHNKLEKELLKIEKEETGCREQIKTETDVLTKKKDSLVKLHEAQIKHALEARLYEKSRKYVDSLGQGFATTEQTLERLSQVETQKTRYQTRRFLSVKDLLHYEAELAKETHNIPAVPVKERRHTKSFFQNEVRPGNNDILPSSPLPANEL